EKGIDLESISIDFIGDIAIIRLNDKSIAKEVADAIMKTNKHIKTVCIDRGVKEDYRIRDVEIIAGEKRTETMHIEYGLKIKLDVAKVYFSPRLSMERMRVAKQVKENEIVIDMFAGVAPFSLLIAKVAKPKKIYAIDINPVAVKYAIENVKLNKMENIIEVIEGDAKDVLPNLPDADHVIMNLPHKSFNFLPLALEKGRILHYYEIMERGKIEERIEKIKRKAEEKYNVEVKNVRIVGSYSPSKQKIGMEIYRLNS
ncbi:MAG: class I SAM-dependent methyltransferase family protein, partial [Thermoplasmata archaeon]|nr:class I SAM-dependent methyltransferase family protein [Thermoplasmata archaeon]